MSCRQSGSKFLLPERVVGSVENGGAQRQESINTLRCPAHPRAFGTGADNGFAGGFSGAAAQVHSLSTEDGIAHALGVDGKVVHGPLGTTAGLPWFRCNGR